jgi:biopolymer transport protein ExbD
MKIHTIALTLLFASFIVSCENHKKENTSEAVTTVGSEADNSIIADTNVLKVYVAADGTITESGTKITLAELDKKLQALKTTKGTVCYARANVESQPPAEAMSVVEAIVKYQLPIRFYTDNTFKKIAKLN